MKKLLKKLFNLVFYIIIMQTKRMNIKTKDQIKILFIN